MGRRLLLLGCVLISCLWACGDDDADAPDGGAPDTGAPDAGSPDTGPAEDAGPERCTIPDTECPEEQPFASAACDTSEECTYPDADGASTWTYTCTDGHWAGTNDCMVPPGGSCPVGPLAEGCRSPFSGSMTGATLELGPTGAGAFRPFDDGETVSLIVGGQGAPMLAFRMRIDGAEIPACVMVETQLTLDGVDLLATMRPTALHCGESLTMFEIVGGDVCRPGPFTLDVHVTVQGVAETTATVMFEEVPCTG